MAVRTLTLINFIWLFVACSEESPPSGQAPPGQDWFSGARSCLEEFRETRPPATAGASSLQQEWRGVTWQAPLENDFRKRPCSRWRAMFLRSQLFRVQRLVDGEEDHRKNGVLRRDRDFPIGSRKCRFDVLAALLRHLRRLFRRRRRPAVTA
jgi:hypothetical protein